ncbi:hypothetical protein [Thalassobacillus cyri]|uniref:hypothetical protein n=1 Tax=Thalassobacillus cyri TaxID=571932 RepID=UPI001FE23970|nr:hypothetical protein [Thalassobacillus cyri]
MKKFLNLNTLYIVAGIIALSSFLIPRAIDMFQLQAHGIRHLAEDVERYHNNTHKWKVIIW